MEYHLTLKAPARNAGSDPGLGAECLLTAMGEYLHSINREERRSDCSIDIDAYALVPRPNRVSVR